MFYLHLNIIYGLWYDIMNNFIMGLVAMCTSLSKIGKQCEAKIC